MKTVTLLLALLCPLTATAEQFVHWQGFDIHYTVFPSTFIPADVAAAHGIKRAKHRMVTNVSVRKDDEPVAARLSGNTTNLLGQVVDLDFGEVVEQTAIYYLATMIVSERDRLNIVINIHPDGAAESYQLEFLRTYE